MATKLWKGYSAKLAASIIPLTDCTLTPGLQEAAYRASGAVNVSEVVARGADQIISITTPDIATALEWAGINGTNLATSGPFVLGLQGAGTGAGKDITFTVAAGLLRPMTLSAPRAGSGQASLVYEILPTTAGGSTDPVVTSIAASLSDTPTGPSHFVLGPIYLDDTAQTGDMLDGLEMVNIDFGLQAIVQHDSGHFFPRDAAIGEQAPRITVEGTDATQYGADKLKTIGKQLETGVVIWLRKLQTGSIPYADDEAEHIKILIPKCLALMGNTSASGFDIAKTSLTLIPYDTDYTDGTFIMEITSSTVIAATGPA